MASIKIVLRKEKKKKDGTYPLAVRITKDRRVRYVHCGYSIHEKYWDDRLREVKKSYPNSARLNNHLLVKRAKAEEVALEMESSNERVSSKEIKYKVYKRGRSVSFFQFGAERVRAKFLAEVYSVAKSERSILCNIEEFVNLKPAQPKKSAIAEIKERRSARIAKGKTSGYSFLEELNQFQKNQALFFEDITESFLSRFKTFCVSHLNMKPRTITNQLVFIRTLFNEAVRDGIVDVKYYSFGGEKEKIRIGSGNKIGMTKEEVERIENIKLKPWTEIWHTRNVWLMSFYFAGIRISDVVALTWKDFKNGRLYYIMDKNNKPVSLKIPNKAYEILKFYESSKAKQSDYVFPYLAKAVKNDAFDVFVKTRNATSLLNKYIKRIGELCDIDKNLSNHIARHTFGNIAGDYVNPLMLQKLYRHSDLKTTINYQANFIHKDADDALDSVIS